MNVIITSGIVLALFTLAAYLRHKKEGLLPPAPIYVVDNILIFAGVVIGWAGAQ